MNELQFCYWLQGWIELENPHEITHEQLEVIKDHLKEVFKKVTPPRRNRPPPPGPCYEDAR